MSTPHPEGLGARLAMQRALAARASTPATSITSTCTAPATRTNDAREDNAVFDLFGDATPCSSTKGSTGHLLGAAGITEAIISMLAIEQRAACPASLHTQTLDPALRSRYLLESETRRVRPRAEQLVRLRRQQLQPRVRARALMRVYVEGVGLARARACGWAASRAVLAGPSAPTSPRRPCSPPATLLPAAERRRTGAAGEARDRGRQRSFRARRPRSRQRRRPCSRPPAAIATTFIAICETLAIRRARGIADALP